MITTVTVMEDLKLRNAEISIAVTRFYCSECKKHLETERTLVGRGFGYTDPSPATIRCDSHVCGQELEVPCYGDQVLLCGPVNRCPLCELKDPETEAAQSAYKVDVMKVKPHFYVPVVD